MKVAIYSRKSMFTGKGESVENQIEMCKDYIKFSLPNVNSDEIFIYEDEGFSAKNLNRPQFQKMMNDLETIKFDYIICYRLDRLSRNVSDFSSLIDLLDKKGVNLVCIKEHFDTSSPMGRAMMYITSVFAQLERETLAERVKDNMHMLARTGRWLGGPPPTGYNGTEVSEVIIDGKIKTSHKLEFNENEIEVVKMMFDKFLENHSVSAVSKHLIFNNIHSRNGKYFSNLGIRDILQNPVYCNADSDAYNYFTSHGADLCNEKEKWNGKYGISAYNKRDYSKSGAPRNDISEWIVAIGKHQGIISGKDWVSIQNFFHDNAKEKVVNHSDLGLLSGLLYCTKCGEKMFTKKQKSTSDNYSYICSSKLRGGTKLCDCQNLLGAQTDDLIVDYIKNEIDGIDGMENKINELKKQYLEEGTSNEADKITDEINAVKTEIDVLTERLTDSKLSNVSIKAIDTKLIEKQSEINELQKRLSLIDSNEFDKIVDIDAILAGIQSFKDCFDNLSVFDKRQIIRLLIQKIEWDGEDLHIFMYGE
jgi:site-specific DNA recombinase